MTRRLIDRVLGFVHDIDTVKSLSQGRDNIRLLSDRSLYILQNLSGEDVTFLSRYGVIEDGGWYEPVAPETPDAEAVYDAVNLIRRDLTDMTVEQTLECICEQLGSISAAISAAQQDSCGCEIGSDVETTDGQEGGPLPDPVNGVDYEQPQPIADRKCLASNYIHQSILAIVTELKQNRVDQYGYAGLAFVLATVSTVVGGLVAGPFGLLAGAVVGAFLSMATLLFKASFSLTLLESAILADEQSAVCALYSAGSSSEARAAYEAVLSDNGATSLELEFVGHLLTNNVLNLLFFEWGDSAETISAVVPTIDCALCAPPPGCPWVFRDDAGGSQPAGSGDLSKDGLQRTLTAELGTDDFYRISIQLDGTDLNQPGDSCGGDTFVNSQVTIHSFNPADPDFATFRVRHWVGSTLSILGDFTVNDLPLTVEGCWIDTSSLGSFTGEYTLYPGNL